MVCKGQPEKVEECIDMIHHDPPDGVEDIISPKEGTGIQHFHIISFALFRITCVRVTPQDHCPIFDQFQDNFGGFHTRSIEGYFVSGFSPDFEGWTVPGADADAYVVHLTK